MPKGRRLGYRGLIANGTPARHPLGSGMGYARFEWSDIAAEGGGVAVTVRNISARAGSDVIQLYRDTARMRADRLRQSAAGAGRGGARNNHSRAEDAAALAGWLAGCNR